MHVNHRKGTPFEYSTCSAFHRHLAAEKPPRIQVFTQEIYCRSWFDLDPVDQIVPRLKLWLPLLGCCLCEDEGQANLCEIVWKAEWFCMLWNLNPKLPSNKLTQSREDLYVRSLSMYGGPIFLPWPQLSEPWLGRICDSADAALFTCTWWLHP